MKNGATRFPMKLAKINMDFILHLVTKGLLAYAVMPSHVVLQLTHSLAQQVQRLERLSSPSSDDARPSWVYPNNIFKSSMHEKKTKSALKKLVKIATITACNTVKVAAQSKSPFFFAGIHDLIAKEFKHYRCCYSSFTFGYTDSTIASVEKSKTMHKTNFDSVKSFISLNVIQLRQVISMSFLMKLYGCNQGKTYIKRKRNSGVPRNVFSGNLLCTRNSFQQR